MGCSNRSVALWTKHKLKGGTWVGLAQSHSSGKTHVASSALTSLVMCRNGPDGHTPTPSIRRLQSGLEALFYPHAPAMFPHSMPRPRTPETGDQNPRVHGDHVHGGST